ncbi:MAG: hypothetical protein V7637_2358 [Mycobacteriales bacterium]|jgi:hypothetical protein
MAGNPGLDEVADELYSLPPEQFVAARDERSKAARSAGDRGLATGLAGLRRPTTSAWVLNLLVRDQPELLDQLLALGTELRAAQRELRGPELRELSTQRQRVVAELVRAARRRAAEAGHPVSTDTGYEVEQTLHAALADPDVARQVCTGRLVKPVPVTGFGAEPTGPAATDGATNASGPGGGTRAASRTEARTDDAERARPAGQDAEPAAPGGRRAGGGRPSRQEAAERRQREREQADRDRAAQEAARRQAERDRLAAARDAARSDLDAAEADVRDASARLAAAEQARTDAAELVGSLEEQLNAARRAQRDCGGQIRDAQRRGEAAARGRDGAARRLADLTARLAAHPE